MKLRNKLLISLFISIFVLMISQYVNATNIELNIGDTHIIKAQTLATKGSADLKDCSVGGTNPGCITATRKGEELDEAFVDDYVEIKALSAGKAEVTITINDTYYVASGDSFFSVPTYDIVTNVYYITVVDPVKEMEEAYKNIPSADADADTIEMFISSDTTYNNSKNFYTISLETAEKWRSTLDNARIDTISRKKYTPIIGKIDNYIAYKKGTGTEDDVGIYDTTISDSHEEAVEATQEYIYSKIEADVIEENRNQGEFTDVLENIGNYKPGDLDESTSNKVEGIATTILTTVTNIGIVVAILMLAILGIKYMLASVEERAEYKKDLVPYFIGAGLLFGITVFVKIFMQWGETIGNI